MKGVAYQAYPAIGTKHKHITHITHATTKSIIKEAHPTILEPFSGASRCAQWLSRQKRPQKSRPAQEVVGAWRVL